MKLDHIIIGMGRCGTTSLSDYINQHPGINSSNVKEVHYFSIDDLYQRGTPYLSEHFHDKPGPTSMADTYLLLSKEGPERIKEHNPNIKITVLLRDPSTRAYSNYHYSLNNGYERGGIGFLESHQKEKEYLSGDIILRNNLCHFEGSLYFKHLSLWLRHFTREQILILRTEDLQNSPQQLMDRLCAFLEVDLFTVRVLDKKNKAQKVRSRSLQQFLLNRNHWLRKTVRAPLKIKIIKGVVLKSGVNNRLYKLNEKTGIGYDAMNEEELKFCRDYFKDDLHKLEESFGVVL